MQIATNTPTQTFIILSANAMNEDNCNAFFMVAAIAQSKRWKKWRI